MCAMWRCPLNNRITAGLSFIGVFLSITVIIAIAALFLPAIPKCKPSAKRITCVNNLKQIGIAHRSWLIDQPPSTNAGGSVQPLNRPEAEQAVSAGGNQTQRLLIP